MEHPSYANSLRRIVYCSECRAAGRTDRNISFILHQPADPKSDWPFWRRATGNSFSQHDPRDFGPFSPYDYPRGPPS